MRWGIVGNGETRLGRDPTSDRAAADAGRGGHAGGCGAGRGGPARRDGCGNRRDSGSAPGAGHAGGGQRPARGRADLWRTAAASRAGAACRRAGAACRRGTAARWARGRRRGPRRPFARRLRVWPLASGGLRDGRRGHPCSRRPEPSRSGCAAFDGRGARRSAAVARRRSALPAASGRPRAGRGAARGRRARGPRSGSPRARPAAARWRPGRPRRWSAASRCARRARRPRAATGPRTAAPRGSGRSQPHAFPIGLGSASRGRGWWPPRIVLSTEGSRPGDGWGGRRSPGGLSFVPFLGLLVLAALAAPMLLRRLGAAAASLRPAPFLCALERPG